MSERKNNNLNPKSKGNAMSAFAKKLAETKVDKKKTSKKSSMPVINNAPECVKKAVDAVNEAKAESKAAAAKLKVNEEVVFDHVRPLQDKEGFAGNHSKSYEVEGVETTVKYVTSNRFSVSANDEENLTELLGADRFEDRFEKTEALTVNKKIFTDQAMQDKLMELMGDHFNEFFEYSSGLKVKADFDKKQYELEEGELEDLRVFAKQAKPALK